VRRDLKAAKVSIVVVLVPAGAGIAQSWQAPVFTSMTAYFCLLLAPTNEMSYDPQTFYNTALSVVAGLGIAALSFRLLPSPAPGLRTRRLLSLALRDLRRLATGPIPPTSEGWERRMYNRLSALPEAAELLQRSQLVAALTVGTEIIHLRHACRLLKLDSCLDAALAAVARGSCAAAAAGFPILMPLSARPGLGALRARARILAIAEALVEHRAYFDARAGV
jgi:uncharacterized membrane protein YccC